MSNLGSKEILYGNEGAKCWLLLSVYIGGRREKQRFGIVVKERDRECWSCGKN